MVIFILVRVILLALLECLIKTKIEALIKVVFLFEEHAHVQKLREVSVLIRQTTQYFSPLY
jgi:hypothetical protein